MSASTAKVLYVEDNPVNRLLVRRVLASAGYDVIEAEDGLSGIQIAREEKPDLILMDIMMPGMDGYQVTTKLKSLKELSETPIVALTAKAMEGDRERALIAGCDGYITKPIDVDRLPDQVAEFLGGKREIIDGGAEEKLGLQQEYLQELVDSLEEKVLELQEANAQLRRTDELKSKFIAIASHELKTPLTVTQGYLMMLLDSRGGLSPGLDEKFRPALQGISKGVERLNGIVQEMLDITSIESGTLEIHPQVMMIKDSVMAAVRQMEPAAQERGLTITVLPMAGLPVLQADASRLKQVFLNLLSNSIKYTPDGGEITISAQVKKGIEVSRHDHPIGSSGKFVQVTFEDMGIGIDPEDQERIFDRFYEVKDVSLHSTGKTRFMGGGMGLGLPIARGIVEAHGGFVWAESDCFDMDACPGSQFHVLLPVEA